MAKLSVTARNNKRKRIAERNRDRREELKRTIKKDAENRDEAVLKLQKRRRDESKTRVRNRCRRCGRPRATLRKFGLCRLCVRIAMMRGDITGMKKASW